MSRNSLIALTVSALLVSSCKPDYTSTDYLETVLERLDRIESATYLLQSENWAPGDTAASDINYSYVQEYDNPGDTTLGVKFAHFLQKDPNQLDFCYDGQMRAMVYPEDKMIVLDSFKIRPLPFRPVTPPFYNFAKNILRYALETTDSISIKMEDQGDRIYVKLNIYEDRQVEFFGKAYHMEPTPYTYGENQSQYELWIDKSNNLPFRARREMSHNISVATSSGFEFNKLDINEFEASNYFPEGYRIQAYRLGGGKTQPHFLLGKRAPGWTLQSADNITIALSDFASEAMLIQFTSVSCGPCKMSIPFLNRLGSEYKPSEFDMVAIECTSGSLEALRNYRTRNHFDFKILLSTPEVRKDYLINSFPVFLILDKNRIVKKVLTGYTEGTTDKEIREIVNELLIE